MTLRPMLMEDADFMLALKNDPITRKFAIVSHEEIKREDHIKWLEKNLKYFQVIEGANKRIGAIRIQDGEVSIWLDPSFRGLGLGTEVLMKLGFYNHTAKIVNGNIASFRAFVKAGFKPVDYKDNYYILQR